MYGKPFDRMTRKELENELKVYTLLGSPRDIAAVYSFSERLSERFESIGTDAIGVLRLISKLEGLELDGQEKQFIKKAIQLVEVYGKDVDIKLLAYDRLTKRRRNYRKSVIVTLKNLMEDCNDDLKKRVQSVIYDLENI